MQKIIAVPVDNNGELDGHFGHCKAFAVYHTENQSIVTEENLIPPPHEPGLLPRWLAGHGVTDILAGGMGNRAIQIFNENKVNVLTGAPKMHARDLVSGFLSQTVEFHANYCDH